MRILCPIYIDFHDDGIVWGLRQKGCDLWVAEHGSIDRTRLARAVEDFRPDLVLTYGWWYGRVEPDDLAWVCQAYDLPHVYWASDDPTHHQFISLPMASRANLVFTTTEELIPSYLGMSKKAAYLQFACNPEIHRRIEPAAERHAIVLVATNYSQYDFMRATYRTQAMEMMLRPLAEAGLDLVVFGDGWADKSFPFHLPPANTRPAIYYRQLAEVYSGARIVLGLQTECHYRTQTSCRVFEAMGCRAFHLAPATRAMSHLFTPGRHLAVSHSPAETLALALHYLQNEAERERIAAAGQLEVYTKHTYLHRAEEFLEIVNEAL
ncbi:MAG: glycosyltransferase [Patescibacteria group bacterium]